MAARHVTRGAARRLTLGLAVRGAAALALIPLAAELTLQVASLLKWDRAGAWRPGAEVRILAVGDSHTYGAYVAEDESYPAQLQVLLDERRPGHFSIINLGIPGLSSSQVHERMAVHVARYEPDLVIVWCGSNNTWNRVGVSTPSRMDGIAAHSRLYRLLRVWQHDRGLEAGPLETLADGTHQASAVDLRVPGRQSWTLRHGGIIETLRNDRAPTIANESTVERMYHDYLAIERWLGAAGIPMILVSYPMTTGAYNLANRAMRRVASKTSTSLIDSPAALARVPKASRDWKKGLHPSGAIYREIALDLVPVVMGLRP